MLPPIGSAMPLFKNFTLYIITRRRNGVGNEAQILKLYQLHLHLQSFEGLKFSGGHSADLLF